MGLRRFDKKFGKDFLREVTTGPAVYLFRDEQGHLLYVGKAKNARRRLQGYRNASRRKAHRKMRTLVREADSLEVVEQASERDALLVENELIRRHRPAYNFDGTFTFLYPAVGLLTERGRTVLCFTTTPDAYREREFVWFGTFRSRIRAREAFEALIEILSQLGHREPRTQMTDYPRVRGSRVVGVRRLEASLVAGIAEYFAGASVAVLEAIALALLEKPRARRDATEVQEALLVLRDFFSSDTRRLHDALRSAGRRGPFVAQDELDSLFISVRYT